MRTLTNLVGAVFFAFVVSGCETKEPDLKTTENHEEVFKRAFWKRPTAGDTIVNAARSGSSWHIEVKPSPALVKYLREDNAFGLSNVPTKKITGAPRWFTYNLKLSETLAAPDGNMHLTFTKEDARLFATGTTTGFQPGAPEQAQSTAPARQPSGRLPTTSPPSQ